MRTNGIMTLLCLTSLLTSCATPGGYTLLGSLAGAGSGTVMGLVADPGPTGRARAQNIFAGMAIGTLLGAGVGFLLEQNQRTKSPPPPQMEKPPASQSAPLPPREPLPPTLIPPEVDGKFIDDQIRGNTFVPGHFEYQIKEPARWTR